MSSSIGTIAGTTGLGSERQAVRAPVGGLWWAFGFTGTVTLASWWSADGTTWTAGNSYTLPVAHSSEGRDLMVECKAIGGIDTFWFTFVATPTVIYAQYALRATAAGSVITYHTLATKVSQSNIAGALTAPAYSGGGLAIASDNKVHVVNGALDPNQDVSWIGTSTADPGAAEQATLPGWGVVTVVDSSQSNVVKSGVTIPMPNGDVFHMGDDGTANSTTTGIASYKKPSGSNWSSVGSATGTVSAFGKNDWNAVKRNDTDIHLVYRNAGGSLVHRRYDGTSWSAGQTIPAQASLADGGVGLCSDGVSVWLAVIDTDGPNTVRYIQWTSGDYTGHADTWDGGWSVVEGSSATRAFLGLARDTDGAFNLLAYWTEGTSMVAALAPAPFPPDPPGLANEIALSALGTLSGAVLTIVFTGVQPQVPGQIRIGFVASWGGAAPSVSSVHDNAVVQNSGTAVAGATNVGSAQGEWVYFIDLGGGATWSGNYTITITFSAAPTEAGGGAIAYTNMSTGAPTATNNASGSATPAAPGSVTPPAAPATYFCIVTDATGANPDTFTWPAPFLKKITETNGSVNQAYSIGTALNSSGAQNPSVTIDSFAWNAGIAVWPGAPVTGTTYRQAFPRLSGLRVG